MSKDREFEAYTLHKTLGYSQKKTAEIMGITPVTAGMYIKAYQDILRETSSGVKKQDPKEIEELLNKVGDRERKSE